MRPMIPVAAAAALALGLTAAAAAPVDAVRAGDMRGMIEEIIAIYEDAGLSWDHSIAWRVGPFTTTFWYYDHLSEEIETGAVPTAAQIEAYWRTWSRVLTDGNFDPSDFFVSEAEARELARYNQFVLAVHESAHAITFRYDYEHLRRHDYDVNCREYYADRLTVAILNDEARRDADMARWRDRYRDLVVAMGETIPEQYRYHIPDFAALDADCALIEVAQPTPETMQPYASAYFERYRVLLEAELPSLAEVFETHLSGPHAASMSDYPVAAERDRLELLTIGELERIELGTVYGTHAGLEGTVSRAAAFDPDGRLWFATLVYDREDQTVEIAFGADPGASPPTGPAAPWPYPSMRLEVASLAVSSEDRFLVALEHWDRAGDDGAERRFVTWVTATRNDDGWAFESLGEIEGMARGAVLRGPDNRIFVFATPDGASAQGSENWRAIELDPATGEASALADLPAFRFPLAIDAEGAIYEEAGHLLWRSAGQGGGEIVIGNGLRGPRDGIGARAEITGIEVLQWMADGRALFVDLGPGYQGWWLRELKSAQ